MHLLQYTFIYNIPEFSMLYACHIKIFWKVYVEISAYNDTYWICLLVFQENGESTKWRIENSWGDSDGDKGKDKFVKLII